MPAHTDLRPRRRQQGQAIVMMGFMILVLCAALGLAVDAGVGYVYNTGAERAAGAAALAGVIFMPDQFNSASAVPAGSRNDASDRAVDEARKNGFDTSDTANNVVVTPATVPGYSNRLRVTVSRSVPVAFMRLFGVNSFTVSRSAVAAHLPPIKVGQNGNQLGSTVSQLGNGGYYVMMIEGWGLDRENGDPFTPNPAWEYSTTNGCLFQCTALSPASTDLHDISYLAGSELSDATLPDRGGYNYRVSLPAGGTIQVYNAAFAPGTRAGPHDYCENFLPGPGQACSPGGRYYMWEEAFMVNPSLYTSAYMPAQRYTIFNVPNSFIRSSDQKLTQMTVYPIDARNFATGSYVDVNTGLPLVQTYDPVTGKPSNMNIYHSWIDVANYVEPAAADLVQYSAGYGPYGGTLPAGNYRLRVDTLNASGAIPSGNDKNMGFKTYAVRVLDASGNPCAACTISAWADMDYFTPLTGATFTEQIFQLPPDYAGQTIGVDIYDPGDISGVGTVTMSILDNTGAVFTVPVGQSVNIYDRGTSRANTPGTVVSTGTTASFVATNAGVMTYNGHWVHLDLPIPSTYNPGADPTTWWWRFQYQMSAGTQANDVVGVSVTFRGSPIRLVPGP
jgi:hypothetical protein